MPRLKPQPVPQAEVIPYAGRWREVGLLVAYLVVCVLAVLTVLMPAIENSDPQEPPTQESEAPNARPADVNAGADS